MAIFKYNYPSTFFPIEIKIIQELDKLFDISFNEKWRGNKIWTTKIKEILSNLGYDLNYISSSTYDGGEWLFDLIWFTNNQNGNFNELILAMESEWYRNWKEINYDFNKLLTTNAIYKLMVCQSSVLEKEGLLEKFQESLNDYNLGNKNERFLISIYNSDEESEFWHYVITRDLK
jgi:hypothetical protein